MMSRLPGKISFELLPFTNLGDEKLVYLEKYYSLELETRSADKGSGEIFKEKLFYFFLE